MVQQILLLIGMARKLPMAGVLLQDQTSWAIRRRKVAVSDIRRADAVRDNRRCFKASIKTELKLNKRSRSGLIEDKN